MDDAAFHNPEDAAMYDGCEIECASNEILLVDPRNGGRWDCILKLGPMPLVCPGKFNTGSIFYFFILQLEAYFQSVLVMMAQTPVQWVTVNAMVNCGYPMTVRRQSKWLC